MNKIELIDRFKKIDEIDDIDYRAAYLHIKSLINHYKDIQDGIASEENFYDNTVAIFEEIKKPRTAPDYISESGSRYWYKKDGLIRGSNHWGNRVANCDWALKLKNGKTIYGNSAFSAKSFRDEKYGFVKWKNFVLKCELIEINGEEVLTSFNNKIGRDIIIHKNKKYQRIITIEYLPYKE